MALWVAIRQAPKEEGDSCAVFNPTYWWHAVDISLAIRGCRTRPGGISALRVCGRGTCRRKARDTENPWSVFGVAAGASATLALRHCRPFVPDAVDPSHVLGCAGSRCSTSIRRPTACVKFLACRLRFANR